MPALWLGYTAATLTTVAFLPQAIKTLRTGDTRSLALSMYAIFTAGVVFWFLYGWAIGDPAIVVANLVTGILSLSILIIKIRNLIKGTDD